MSAPLIFLHRLCVAAALLSLVSACGGGGSGGSPPPPQPTGTARIDQAVTTARARRNVPGVAVAVVREGRLVFAQAWGTADRAGAEPLRPDHLFRVASVSKPVTGAALLKAEELGLIDLEAPAFDILAAYRPPAGTGDPRLGQVTVWHLAHHTAGWDLWNYPRGPLHRSQEIADAQGTSLPPGPDAVTAWLARQPLAAEPGALFQYSNAGYVVLGRVIEAATGYRYEDFVRRHVLEPAGIQRAALAGIRPAERLPGEVEYLSESSPLWTSVYDGTTVVPEPAYGGINLVGFDASSAWVMSVVDLARLGAATDGDPAYPDVLAGSAQARMVQVGTPPGTAYGFGWFLGTRIRGGLPVAVEWNHSGGMPGTVAFLGRLPDGTLLAIAANADAGGRLADELIGGVVGAVLGIQDWPETDLFSAYP